MGSWSATRRLLYLLGVLIVIAALGAALFLFYKPEPSCTDGRQNQDELAIDCGGVCQRVCPIEITPLRPIWTRIFKVDEGKYDTATFLVNPNPRHGVKEFLYTVKIFDKANLLIKTETGRGFMNPKENLLVLDTRLDVGLRTPVRALFEFDGAPIWQRLDRVIPPVTAAAKVFTNDPWPRLAATVSNNSLVDLSNVVVSAVLSDNEQNAMAVSSTLVEQLDHNSSQEIVFTWPKPFAAVPAFSNLYPHFDLGQVPVTP
ncbi:MAG: hypothetical protein HYT48_03070 [Candidatus Vogelbacteria bacterium]|nr:hypothetical protein [Candidatus Vogelbacteria bacterium]